MPTSDLLKVYAMCPDCRTGEDVYVAFSAHEYWNHVEREHPETIVVQR